MNCGSSRSIMTTLVVTRITITAITTTNFIKSSAEKGRGKNTCEQVVFQRPRNWINDPNGPFRDPVTGMVHLWMHFVPIFSLLKSFRFLCVQDISIGLVRV